MTDKKRRPLPGGITTDEYGLLLHCNGELAVTAEDVRWLWAKVEHELERHADDGLYHRKYRELPAKLRRLHGTQLEDLAERMTQDVLSWMPAFKS